MKSLRKRIEGGSGFVLDARLELPDEPVSESIVISNCFTCNKDILTSYRLAKRLTAAGYAVLRFDFSGLGNSEGDFAQTGFMSMVDDIKAVSTFLDTQNLPCSTLLGHSMGGTASLRAALDISSVENVITIASPSQPAHVLHHFGSALDILHAGEDASIEVGGIDYRITPGFLRSFETTDLTATYDNLDKPVLIFDIDGDSIVDEINAIQLDELIVGETERITILGSDHLLSDSNVIDETTDTIVSWLRDR